LPQCPGFDVLQRILLGRCREEGQREKEEKIDLAKILDIIYLLVVS